ncbi:hypothetical protein GCM10010233_13450 [Streptomyces pseudogriseolus]|uniref:Uncharacterized protein n=1 Tax=Streptomyces pseudogriseolus TaxID=36817 RepID=A0ABQ2SGJ0_STREZ|nr:hypothetical protein GCM10010233_13450 [Streptomyces gancidicus]GGS27508.1 hypothetical protein GCM10010285_01890 [Streptomyces rubiginosus]
MGEWRAVETALVSVGHLQEASAAVRVDPQADPLKQLADIPPEWR